MNWKKKALDDYKRQEKRIEKAKDTRNKKLHREIKQVIKKKLDWDIDTDKSIAVSYIGETIVIDNEIGFSMEDTHISVKSKCLNCGKWDNDSQRGCWDWRDIEESRKIATTHAC